MMLGVKHRENLRFARTKIWGVVRNLFRGVGKNLHGLGVIKSPQVCFVAALHMLTNTYLEGCVLSHCGRAVCICRRSFSH